MTTMKSTVGLILDAVTEGGYGGGSEGGSAVGMISAVVDGDGLTLGNTAQNLYRGMQEGAILPIVCLADDGEFEFDFIVDIYEGETGLTFSTMTGKHYVAFQPSDYPTTKTNGSSTGPK